MGKSYGLQRVGEQRSLREKKLRIRIRGLGFGPRQGS